MQKAIEILDGMIEEAKEWRLLHREAGRKIEAFMSAVRERALIDARRAILEASEN